ncbi:lipid-A-disaccharide synthase [Profundibacter sp.]
MRFYLIAGEPSGDALGAALMAGLKELLPDVEFSGVGGPLMQAQGLHSQFPMDELSVMGLAEVLPKYRALKRRIAECAETVLAQKPDALITIDSPDFCLRVAKIVKAQSNTRTIHYVAPSVWAWREGRAVKMARVIDHVLALLPFEPPLMQAAGMGCDFVGHPVVAEPQATAEQAQDFRTRYGLNDAPLLLALPGSRRGEVERLMPVFGKTIGQLHNERPNLRIVLPAAPSVDARVRKLVTDWPIPPLVLDAADLPEKRAAFAAADVALAASGTVSLELAAANTPMVIAYDMNWLSRILIGRMLKVDTVTLVNLVSETRVVPEFLGKNCAPGKIAQGVLAVLNNPQNQQQAMALTMERLGRDQEPPGLRAARAVLQAL